MSESKRLLCLLLLLLLPKSWQYTMKSLNNTNRDNLSYKLIFYSALFTGNVKLNVAPLPSELFSAQVFSPRTSIILFEIYNPNPVPESDLLADNLTLKKVSKIFSLLR